MWFLQTLSCRLWTLSLTPWCWLRRTRMERKTTCSSPTTFPTLHSRGTFRYSITVCFSYRQNLLKIRGKKKWHLTAWLELHQLAAVISPVSLPWPNLLSVPASPRSKPWYPSSSNRAVVEGCSRAPWCHQRTLPSSTGGDEEDVSSHRSGEDKEAEDECSDFWQRVSLIQCGL